MPYPKTLADPLTVSKADAEHTLDNHNGTFSRLLRVVNDEAEEFVARQDGYTHEVPQLQGGRAIEPFMRPGTQVVVDLTEKK